MKQDVEKRVQKIFAEIESTLSKTDPEFMEIITNFSQDETVKVNNLTEKEQVLCILSTLLGCQGMGEFQNMLHAALNMGIDPIAIKEVIYQSTAYLGIGRVYDFLTVTNQIMEQHGIKLPLSSQATTSEKTRFEDGLKNRLLCSVRIWLRDRQKVLSFAGISTAGWQIIALAITIPEMV